jgi:hypothetical protein
MFEYQKTEYDEVLLKIASMANETNGVDGIPESPTLCSAHAIENYVAQRTIAAVIHGLKMRGIDINEKEIIGAYVDGKQEIPNLDFVSPLIRGKKFTL